MHRLLLRKLRTKAGEVLKVPKLPQQAFETAIIESGAKICQPRWHEKR
jgi:hypothetical protein